MIIKKINWLLFFLASISNIIPNNRLFGVNFTISDTFIILSFSLIIIERILKRQNPLIFFDKRYIWLWISFYFIALGGLLSMFKAIYPNEVLFSVVQYLFIFMVMVTVLDYLLDNNMNNVIKILGIWLIQYLVSTSLVILSSAKILTLFDEYIKAGSGRYQGLFGLSTSMGMNTVLSIVILALLWKVSKRNISLLMFIFVIMSIIAVVLSVSFGSMMLLIIALVTSWLLISKFNTTHILVVLGLLLVAFFYFLSTDTFDIAVERLIPDIVAERLERTEGELGSADHRMKLNIMGINYFIEHPLIGVGLDQFKLNNFSGNNIHNTIIAMAAEAGIFGLIGLLIILFAPLLKAKQLLSRVQYEYEKTIILFLITYCIVRIAQTGISGPFVQRWPWIPILLLFILCPKYEKFRSLYKKT